MLQKKNPNPTNNLNVEEQEAVEADAQALVSNAQRMEMVAEKLGHTPDLDVSPFEFLFTRLAVIPVRARWAPLRVCKER